MFKRLTYLAAVFLIFFTFTITAHADCLPDEAEMAWLSKTITVWKQVRSEALSLDDAKLPWLVLFDEKCVLNINPDAKFFSGTGQALLRMLGDESVALYSSEHNGKVTLPDSSIISPALISFAATYDSGKRSFFAASLPSIWRKAPHLAAEKNLETLVRSVYIHELTHTYHRNFFAQLDLIEKGLKDVEVFDDDVVQNVFGKDVEFRKDFLEEIAIAAKAVETSDRSSKRKAARQIAGLMSERRRKFYSKQNRVYTKIEDIFLTMEGVANWAAYKAAIVDGLNSGEAKQLIRRGGKYWSQEQGILLFLLIDDLLPNWQKTVFGTDKVSITTLLKQAGR